MTERIPEREAQALREVGRTTVARSTAWLVLLFLIATISGVPLLQATIDWVGAAPDEARLVPRLREVAAGLRGLGRVLKDEGALAVNRELLASIDTLEDRIESESLLREKLLPRVQSLLTAISGLGNEQAYLGRGNWLFYRADVDFVTGPGFLEPEALESRRRGGDAWEAPPEPDPLPALLDFDRQLGNRGIRLIVLPTPVKPMVHPEKLSRRFSGRQTSLDNASGERFKRELREAGVPVLEVDRVLADGAEGRASFLETDTHWTPEAVDRVAERLAEEIRDQVELTEDTLETYRRRPVLVDGLGDIFKMLRLPPDTGLFQSERITVQRVEDAAGRPWRPDREAEVLLLGDSFTNVFSDPSLGWGGGGGLAEQLAFHLGRPVDRIALNAGGAQASRQALARQVSGSADRLAGKRVVVYQFAVRELAGGDWSLINLGPK